MAQAFRIAEVTQKPATDEEGQPDASRRLWETTWMRLVSEADTLQSACLQECSRIPEIADSKDCLSEGIGLWAWMDECLWSGLSQLRSEVRSLRPTVDAGHAGGSSSDEVQSLQRSAKAQQNLREFQDQQKQLAETLDVAASELESAMESFSIRCSGWVMETSILDIPAMPSPPWRGVRGGDGGAHESGKGPLNVCALAGVPGSSPLNSHHAWEDDAVANELHESLVILEEEIRQAGGPTGGWRDGLHDSFKRIFRVFRGQPSPALCDRMAERFPEINREEIAAHVQWFLEFEQRQSVKRQLLAKRRQRLAELPTEVADAQYMDTLEETRRRQGLRRSHSAGQRQLVEKWRQSQAEMQQQAVTVQRTMRREEIKLEKERHRKDQEKKDKQRKVVDAFRQRRDEETHEAEKRAASLEGRRVPMSPEVKQRIKKKEEAMLKKHQEATNLLLRSLSQPSIRSPISQAYRHVESKLYTPTASWNQRTAARQAKETPTEPEPEAATSTCMRALGAYRSSLKGSWTHPRQDPALTKLDKPSPSLVPPPMHALAASPICESDAQDPASGQALVQPEQAAASIESLNEAGQVASLKYRFSIAKHIHDRTSKEGLDTLKDIQELVNEMDELAIKTLVADFIGGRVGVWSGPTPLMAEVAMKYVFLYAKANPDSLHGMAKFVAPFPNLETFATTPAEGATNSVD